MGTGALTVTLTIRSADPGHFAPALACLRRYLITQLSAQGSSAFAFRCHRQTKLSGLMSWKIIL